MSEPVLTIFEGMSEVIAFDYVNAMPLGADEITAATIEAHEWVNNKPGEDLTDDFIVVADADIVNQQVRFQFQDPPLGKTIRVKTLTEFSDGQKRVNRMFFEVKEA